MDRNDARLTYGPSELALVARLNEARMRASWLLWLRRLSLSSTVGWILMAPGWLPRPVQPIVWDWLAGCTALVAAHAWLEYRCRRRATGWAGAGIEVHLRRPKGLRVASGLWIATGILSLVPWVPAWFGLAQDAPFVACFASTMTGALVADLWTAAGRTSDT